jgi:hypothetical protein
MALNQPLEEGVDPLRAHIHEVIESDGWVPIPYDDGPVPRPGYARHLAEASQTGVRAIVFVGPPIA